MTIEVRPEEPADAVAVQQVIAAAFPAADGTPTGTAVEVGLNDALRRHPAWIPRLSLVAVRDGRVVGQLTSSYGTLTDPAGGRRPVPGIGPVAVAPAEQGTGVGTALLTAVIERARRSGEPALVLLGDPVFYGRFGFRPAAAAGITPPDPAWGEHFQALVLTDGPSPAGAFRYAAPFDDLSRPAGPAGAGRWPTRPAGAPAPDGVAGSAGAGGSGD
ncbi:GNAT family N-acetyltransferase [Nakamurella sp.]|uniref:GNAT family N-acetyltransferase n=1 Tax=Nakamurella sp. TaxID=1869182 RepID=UPI003B3A4E16